MFMIYHIVYEKELLGAYIEFWTIRSVAAANAMTVI